MKGLDLAFASILSREPLRAAKDLQLDAEYFAILNFKLTYQS